jgi:C-terminal processing protease CtpA/Prc
VELRVQVYGHAPRTITLRPEEFLIESVEGLYRDDEGQWVCRIPKEENLIYLRIREFVPDTLDQLQQHLRGLNVAGLVLDLRDNPGGEFTQALAVSDLFLDHGTIVTVRSRQETKHYTAHSSGGVGRFPLVVLVNGGSASGAEIVAGSLAVNDRSVLLGTRTCGKGCMQEQIPLGDLGQINLTTAEYFVGEDQPISFVGVTPHEEVGIDPSLWRELERQRLKIALVAPTLPGASTKPATAATSVGSAALADDLIIRDSQLYVAIQMLRNPKGLVDILDKAKEARLAAKARAATRPARP